MAPVLFSSVSNKSPDPPHWPVPFTLQCKDAIVGMYPADLWRDGHPCPSWCVGDFTDAFWESSWQWKCRSCNMNPNPQTIL